MRIKALNDVVSKPRRTIFIFRQIIANDSIACPFISVFILNRLVSKTSTQCKRLEISGKIPDLFRNLSFSLFFFFFFFFTLLFFLNNPFPRAQCAHSGSEDDRTNYCCDKARENDNYLGLIMELLHGERNVSIT